jgi:hypothetical protein
MRENIVRKYFYSTISLKITLIVRSTKIHINMSVFEFLIEKWSGKILFLHPYWRGYSIKNQLMRYVT